MEYESDARHSKNCPSTCFCAASEEKRLKNPLPKAEAIIQPRNPSLLDAKCGLCNSPVASFLKFCACGADFNYHPPLKR
jgi:hypothetical protein